MKQILLCLLFVLTACRGVSPDDHKVGAIGTNSGGTAGVIATTGSTSSNGIAVVGPARLASASITNLTGSALYATFQDQSTVPDAGFSNLYGAPVFVPANYQVILGTDFFGADGWYFKNGVSVGMTTTGSSDAGGTFTAAGSACCDITLNGHKSP